MKVLSRGKFELQVTCGGCSARLQVEKDDVQLGNFAVAYAGETSDRQYYVECPECGKVIIIPRQQVPTDVRKMAREKRKKRMEREQ